MNRPRFQWMRWVCNGVYDSQIHFFVPLITIQKSSFEGVHCVLVLCEDPQSGGMWLNIYIYMFNSRTSHPLRRERLPSQLKLVTPSLCHDFSSEKAYKLLICLRQKITSFVANLIEQGGIQCNHSPYPFLSSKRSLVQPNWQYT